MIRLWNAYRTIMDEWFVKDGTQMTFFGYTLVTLVWVNTITWGVKVITGWLT